MLAASEMGVSFVVLFLRRCCWIGVNGVVVVAIGAHVVVEVEAGRVVVVVVVVGNEVVEAGNVVVGKNVVVGAKEVVENEAVGTTVVVGAKDVVDAFSGVDAFNVRLYTCDVAFEGNASCSERMQNDR